MYKYWLINCNKGTTLMSDVKNRRNCVCVLLCVHVWGGGWQERGYMKTLYFPLNFSVNLKLLLKTNPIN